LGGNSGDLPQTICASARGVKVRRRGLISPYFARGRCTKMSAMINAFRIASRLLALLLLLASALPALAAEPKPQVRIVAFGLFGDQDVFESEAKGAAQIVASRFGGAPAVVRFNSKTREEATAETLAATLQATAMGMDADHDILFVILTSHGSRAGIAVKTPSREATLSPLDLVTMLDATHVRHRIVVASACFSGVFIPPLADPDTLVVTAADENHPSFGCSNRTTWTYFGDAFFNMALRRTANLHEAFALASVAIRKRELQNHYEPSNPQMAGGENVERLLAGDQDGPRLDARYAPAFVGRGGGYVDKGAFDQAIAAYSEAIRLDPTSARAYAGRGLANRAKGDLERAMADSNQALTLDPKLAEAYNIRGMTHISKGEREAAITDYSEAIRLDPRRFIVYTNRGIAFAAKGDNDHAIADYSEALKLEPRFYFAYYQRGITYGARGDNNRAIADFNQAIKLNPKFAEAFDKRGLAYRAKGDTTRADADLKEAVRLKASGAHP
jgi:tetratricopeptide (TPR) repeat protein